MSLSHEADPQSFSCDYSKIWQPSGSLDDNNMAILSAQKQIVHYANTQRICRATQKSPIL